MDTRVSLKRLIRKEVLVTLALSAIVMPAFTYYVLASRLEEVYRNGSLLVALAPSGIIMLVLSKFVPDRDEELIMVNFFVSQFSIITYLPIILHLFLGKSTRVASFKLFAQSALLVFGPYLASMAINRKENLKRALFNSRPFAVPLMIFLVISISIADASEKILISIDLLYLALVILCIYLLQGGLAYLSGRLFFDETRAKTLALVASSRNIQFIIAVALLNFAPMIIVPLIMGILLHHVTNLFWISIFQGPPKGAAA